MKILKLIPLLLLALISMAQTKPNPIGLWEGDSVCQVPKPCTTEHVIYEIKQSADGQITIKADKVVQGQREWMGDINCQWLPTEQKLHCPMDGRRPGVWEFQLTGDELKGTLTITEGNVLFRKIAVKRKG